MKDFNPSKIGVHNGNFFGLPVNYDNANVVILPVPWEVTVMGKSGTARAPYAVLQASPSIPLFDFDVAGAWELGIFGLPVSQKWLQVNDELRPLVLRYYEFLQKEGDLVTNSTMQTIVERVNEACKDLNKWISEQASKALGDGKLVGVLGGDHSSALGLLSALCERHRSFGVLQIGAYANLRVAHAGFVYANSSVMFNAINHPEISKLISVGVREVVPEELALTNISEKRIEAFYDPHIKELVHLEGTLTWAVFCQRLVAKLPSKVYISFDIAGLVASLCPNTGRPAMGGLQVEEVFYLLKMIQTSGRQIIGFDLCEIAPDIDEPKNDWDAKVGAKVLYKLCNIMGASNGFSV